MTERKGSTELVILLSLVLCAFLVGLTLYQQLPAFKPPPTATESRSFDLDALAQEMARIRQLPLLAAIPWEAMDETQLKEKLLAMNAEMLNQKELQSSEKVLQFLGLIPSAPDLGKLLLDLYGQEIVGFYDPPAKKMYLIRRELMGFPERLTFAHELAHGLVDQRFDLGAFLQPLSPRNDDEATAARCLVEGDAGMAQTLYLQAHRSAGAALSLFLSGLVGEGSALASAPSYLRDALLFPYQGGFPFVQAVYQDGGWAAVDQAYAAPPLSSEQILHPEKYLGEPDLPIEVEIPEYPEELTGWTLVRDNVLGELDFRSWFRTFLPDADADQAAAGWGGCRYQLWQKEGLSAFILNSRWDSADDAWEAQYALEMWLKYRFRQAPEVYFQGGLYSSPREAAVLYPDRSSLQLVMSPDEESALALLKNLP
ncbi:MAG: hypothetical protein NTV33_12000 [Coprothermobacterota bacterium]|nr:hypothetical protein [Coprothermobacterota bacterium]